MNRLDKITQAICALSESELRSLQDCMPAIAKARAIHKSHATSDEFDRLADLNGHALQVVADCLVHGAAMPSGFEIVSRTEISPPGPVFAFVEAGVAKEARNPAREQVVVRAMGVKYGFRREVV